MRVGLVIYGSLDFPSGGFLYDRMLVRALQRAGDTVDVISLPWEGYAKCLMHRFNRRLCARILDWRGDILVQDELVHPSLFVLNSALRRTHSIPIVSIVHHLRASEPAGGAPRVLVRAVERAYLRTVDGFVFNSGATRRAVQDLEGGGRPGVVVQPAGDRLGCPVSGDEAALRAGSPGPLQVLFVGNLIPRKGLLTLLEALAAMALDTWRLCVIGSRAADPAHAREVDRFVKERGLRGNVRVEDHVDDRMLADELRAHHVLAVPSWYEGFGIVYLEAMGYGVVPVGTRAGGAAEIVEDGIGGFLVPPGDPPALSAVLHRLAADRAFLGSCARAARNRFAAFPGWEAQMERIVAFLRSTIDPGRAG
jgi:glycosyltransferase involved in cell wall biosynthesis